MDPELAAGLDPTQLGAAPLKITISPSGLAEGALAGSPLGLEGAVAGDLAAGAEGLAGLGNAGLFTGGFGLAGLLGGLLGPTASVASPEAIAIRNAFTAAGGGALPTTSPVKGRLAGSFPVDIDAVAGFLNANSPGSAASNLLNSVLGISPAGAAEYPPVNLPVIAGPPTPPADIPVTPVSRGTPVPVDTWTPMPGPAGGHAVDPVTGETIILPSRGAPTPNLDATTAVPTRNLPLTRGNVILGTGGPTPAPGASAASFGANPNVASSLPQQASTAEILDLMKDPNAIEKLTTVGPTAAVNTVNLPGAGAGANAPATPPGDSSFWKEYGPLLGLGVGGAGLAYGLLSKKKEADAQAAQQETAALQKQVASNVQSGVIDPTNTALQANELLAKTGLAASQDITGANSLLNIFNSGKLPPAMQAMYDQALQDADAASKGRFANMGIGNSTEMDKLLNANRLRSLASQGSAYQDLYKLGLQTQKQGTDITAQMINQILTGSGVQTGALTGAGNLYNQIAKDQIAADKDLVEAISKFATQLSKAGATT